MVLEKKRDWVGIFLTSDTIDVQDLTVNHLKTLEKKCFEQS